MLDSFSHSQGNNTSELLILCAMLTHNLDYLLVTQLNISHILTFSMYVFQRLHPFFYLCKSLKLMFLFVGFYFQDGRSSW